MFTSQGRFLEKGVGRAALGHQLAMIADVEFVTATWIRRNDGLTGDILCWTIILEASHIGHQVALVDAAIEL